MKGWGKRLRIFLIAFVIAVLIIPSVPLFTVPVFADSIDLYFVGGGGSTGKLWSDTLHWSATTGYNVGTATFTSGSNAVTGSGTSWDASMNGYKIISSEGTLYTINAVSDGTDLTLTGNYGTTTITSAYSIFNPGHAVPNATNNVFIDANSFVSNGSISIQTTNGYCNNIDTTGVLYTPRLSITGTNRALNVSGNVILTGMTFYTGSVDELGIALVATGAGHTINTTGATFGYGGTTSMGFVFNGVGGEWTLQNNMTGTTSYGIGITLSAGTLNTANFTLGSAAYGCGFGTDGSTTRVVHFGSSSIYLGFYNGWQITNGTNLTLDMGTSTIYASNGQQYPTFAGGGQSYNNVVLSPALAHAGSITISGANTFTNLTKLGNNVSTESLLIAADQVITGTLTMTGYSTVSRMLLGSSVTGTQHQITAAAVNITNCNVSDWAGVGASSWNISAGLNCDFGNNLGITFTVPQQNYWVGNGGNWSDITHWASTSGGVSGTGRVPLTQDSCVFDANSFSIPGRTVTVDVTNVGAIISTNVTNSPTISKAGEIDIYAGIYGGITMGTMTWSVTSTYLKGATTFPITATGAYTFTGNLYIATSSTYMTSVNFISNFTVTGTIYVSSGTLCLQGFNITAQYVDSSTTTYVRALNLSTGTLTLNGTGAVTKFNMNATNLSVYCGTSTIIFTNSTANTQTFAGAGLTYYNFTIQGAGDYQTTLSGNNVFNDFTIDRSVAHKTLAGNVTSTVANLYIPINGVVTVTINNSDFSKSSSTVVTDYLNFNSGANTCTAAGGATFYAGVHSITSPQTGWNFSDPALPTVTTLSATQVYPTSGVFNGNVTSMGGYGTLFAYFQYNTSNNFTTYSSTNPKTTKTGTGTYYFAQTGLTAGLGYYFRAVVSDGFTDLATGSAVAVITSGGIIPPVSPWPTFSPTPEPNPTPAPFPTPTTPVPTGFLPTPTPTSGFQITPTPKDFPGKDIITSIAGNTPVQVPWMLITGFIILTCSLVTSWIMKRFGSNNLIIKIGVIIGLMGIFVGLGIYDFWMVLIFGILAAAIAMASRTQTV